MATEKASGKQTSTEASNVVYLMGTVRVEPTIRSSPDETILVTFDVVTMDGASQRTVPVSWEGPSRSHPISPKVTPLRSWVRCSVGSSGWAALRRTPLTCVRIV